MTLTFDSLQTQRRAAGPFVVAVVWLLVPAAAALALAGGGEALRPALAAAACAAFATLTRRLFGDTVLGRALPGVALMAQISLLVASGGAWQIDMHMAYFAGLALLVVYSDWVVILAAAATVAVHHLVLGSLLPAAVFDAGSGIDRIALHAVILAVEAGTLVWVTANLDHIFTLSGHSLDVAQSAAAQARTAGTAAELARDAARRAEAEAGVAAEQARAEERAMVLESIGGAVSSLQAGDFTYTIVQRLPDEYGVLRAEFNGALTKLQDTMRTVAASAAVIRVGTSEISAASEDLSRRTEQQAASLEETAAALDEITATVRKTAEGAKSARAAVLGARTSAERSGAVVREAVEAMSGIERSSHEIGQIIGVIDEIAFQTSLLALNAGVEAARAGDAGRGFAVVASEVRALAQRSADAAKEIKALISSSGRQVEQGVIFVGQTGEVLSGIAAQVGEIDTIMDQIAVSAQEQATGLDQINTAVNNMDHVTQQNAAMVERTTAASRTLTAQTHELAAILDGFHLGEARPTMVDAGAPERRSVAHGAEASGRTGRGGTARRLALVGGHGT